MQFILNFALSDLVISHVNLRNGLYRVQCTISPDFFWHCTVVIFQFKGTAFPFSLNFLIRKQALSSSSFPAFCSPTRRFRSKTQGNAIQCSLIESAGGNDQVSRDHWIVPQALTLWIWSITNLLLIKSNKYKTAYIYFYLAPGWSQNNNKKKKVSRRLPFRRMRCSQCVPHVKILSLTVLSVPKDCGQAVPKKPCCVWLITGGHCIPLALEYINGASS